MAKQMFYLQNVSAGCVGNCAQFWRRGGSGYTTDIDDAQQFADKEADDIIRTTRGSHAWEKWEVSVVHAAARRTFDAQHLRQHIPSEGR